MAQIAEWGPHLWTVLHTMAEQAGKYVLQMDEIRAWIHVLRLTEGILPCAMCRAHYKKWRLSHPLEEFLIYRGEDFREKLREWIWGLHDSVNRDRGVASFPLEDLHIYRDIEANKLHESLQTLVKLFEKAILHRQVNAIYVSDWRKAIALLRKLG